MSEEDVQRSQDTAAGKYSRLKQTAAITASRLRDVSREMSEVAKALNTKSPDDLLSFTFHQYSWFKPEVITHLAQDAVRARQEAQKARQEAIDLGVAISD